MALLTVDDRAQGEEYSCHVLVVGDGMGGVAAVWALIRHGHDGCLLGETDWVGGQMTSQGISALDEHEHIEQFGDLLPLTGPEYVVGAESAEQTAEPHAQPDGPRPNCVQTCTYPFAFDRRPEDEDHRLPQPTHYEDYHHRQPYSLRIHVHGGEIYGETTGWLDYDHFNDTPGTKGALWSYRRPILARKTVLEQEVAVADQRGPRAAHCDDTVDIGWYHIDIHQISQDEVGTRTRPFQIPLGALIPARVENLIATNKNIGTTHITNGCHRLHPVE